MLYKDSSRSIIFENRYEAGEKLAFLLHRFLENNTYVIGLPRGGVEVAFPICMNLRLPMDVIIARKITLPSQPEFAIGAISESGITQMNETLVNHFHLSQEDITQLVNNEKKELHRQIQNYRGNRSLSYLSNATVFVIDDGVATGLTAQAALRSIRLFHPKNIVFATPVCAAQSLLRLQKFADHVVSIITPSNLHAVGNYYRHFAQVDDNRVMELVNVTHHYSTVSSDCSSYKLF